MPPDPGPPASPAETDPPTSTAGPAAPRSLQRFYEDPATPLSSGTERARLQAGLLADHAVAAGRPLRGLDIGCGDGMATAVALETAAARPGATLRMVGCDWSLAGLGQADARGVRVVRASIDEPGLPFGSGSFDVVVMSELIEHLVDTDKAVAEAWRLLAPGGSLFLSTPNLAAWFNRVLLLLGIQPLFTEVSLGGIYGRPGKEVVGHLRLFTRRALLGFLEANGFVEVTITGAPYHDVPRLFRPLDRLLCHLPGLSSILLATARKPG